MDVKDKKLSERIFHEGMDLQSIEKNIEKRIIKTDFFKAMDLDKLQESMDSFKMVTGVDIDITLLNGKIIVDTKGENLCRRFHRNHPQLGLNCFEDKEEKTLRFNSAGKKAIKIPGVNYPVYQCENQILFGVVPIEVRGHHVANLILRNFFIEGHLEPYELIKQGKKAGFNEEEYMETIKSYEVMSPEKFNETMKYLAYVAEMISEMAYSKKSDEELKEELRESLEELSASYEELLAIEEELRDQLRIVKEKDQKITDTETAFEALYEKMSEGLAIHEMIYDEKGRPWDYRFLKVNESFEALTGLRAAKLVGSTVREVLPGTEDHWIEAYGKVVQNNEVLEMENYSKELKRYYNVKAYKLEGNQFATLVRDVTNQKKQEQKEKRNWFQTVAILGEMVERRDAYTAGHQKNVAVLSRRIGEKLGLEEHRLEGLYLAGLLHDIGKIQVPTEILSKPTRLLAEEFNLIKVHSKSGYDLLKNIEFPWDIANFVLQHHEKLDGSGYPRGLKGEEILLESRILAATDIVEAISSHRPYRPALGVEFAIKEMQRGRKTLYDPEVVDAIVSLYEGNELPEEILR